MVYSGKHFQGWSTDKNAAPDPASLVAPGTKLAPTENRKYFAIWGTAIVPGGYTVTIDKNGAAAGDFTEWGDTKSKTPSKYEAIRLPFDKNGMTGPDGFTSIDGLSTEKDGTGEHFDFGALYTPESDITLHADWYHEVALYSAVTGGNDTSGTGLSAPTGNSSGKTNTIAIVITGENDTGLSAANFELTGGAELVAKVSENTSGNTTYVMRIIPSESVPQEQVTLKLNKPRNKLTGAAGYEKVWVFNGESVPVKLNSIGTPATAGNTTGLVLTFDTEILGGLTNSTHIVVQNAASSPVSPTGITNTGAVYTVAVSDPGSDQNYKITKLEKPGYTITFNSALTGGTLTDGGLPITGIAVLGGN